MGNAAVTAAIGTVVVILLPNSIAMQSDVLCQLRESLRRAFLPSVDALVESLLFRAFALCARRCSCGRLASPCRVPHSLRAQAVSRRELVLWWTPSQTSPRNVFHEEVYLCAWRLSTPEPPESCSTTKDADSTDVKPAAEEKPEDWREVLLDGCQPVDGEQGDPGCRRHTALLQDLPDSASLRLRVCAVNRYGRSDWSKEEIELELLKQDKLTDRQMSNGIGRSHAVTSSGRLCVQCLTPQRPGSALAYAEVACRPVVGGRDCKHGPFCSRCRRGVVKEVLPSCVCRGLIDIWREVS